MEVKLSYQEDSTTLQYFALESDVYWTVHHCDSWRIKNQLDVTCYIYFTS